MRKMAVVAVGLKIEKWGRMSVAAGCEDMHKDTRVGKQLLVPTNSKSRETSVWGWTPGYSTSCRSLNRSTMENPMSMNEKVMKLSLNGCKINQHSGQQIHPNPVERHKELYLAAWLHTGILGYGDSPFYHRANGANLFHWGKCSSSITQRSRRGSINAMNYSAKRILERMLNLWTCVWVMLPLISVTVSWSIFSLIFQMSGVREKHSQDYIL